MIDCSEEDVEDRFRTIDRELALYGAGLDERPQAIVLNKIDLLPELPDFPVEDERIVGVFRVSCATGAGIDELKLALFRLCPAAPEPKEDDAPELPDFLEYRPQAPARRTYRIYRTDRGFRIIGEAPVGRGARGGAEGRRRPQGPGRRDRRRGPGMAVGILGGRFDPPHVGHLALARTAVEHFGLDELHVTVVADAGPQAVRGARPSTGSRWRASRSPTSTRPSSSSSTATRSTRSRRPATTTRSS